MSAAEAWDHGNKAWRRLAARPDGPTDGDAALAALSDIGAVRRLLDQAELAAVRSARRNAKSWAEIATHLGVTRQSAWQRWRDLDDSSAGDGECRRGVNLTTKPSGEGRGRATLPTPNRSY
ncbi:MAG: hypothetical protein JOZ23_14855 [Mycobacterium sp.]|nr:hypothetical protein [Mycobacterium sp.]